MKRRPSRNRPEEKAHGARTGLSTGHGLREHSSVTCTTFERCSRNPEQIVTIRYDSLENLVSMGVIPRQTPWQPVRPQPFPETLPRQYVPDPPGQ